VPNIYLKVGNQGLARLKFNLCYLGNHVFKIEQSVGIWLGLDTSFNGFKEDNKLFVHKMHRILRQDCRKWPALVSKGSKCDSSSINCNF